MDARKQAVVMLEEMQKLAGVPLEIAACRHIGRQTQRPPIIHRLHDGNANKLLAWAGVENMKNEANIWIRPVPDQPHPLLFLDDLPRARAEALARKYKVIVVETSTNNFQARLVASRPMDEHDRFIIQSALQKLLGADADAGSTAGGKWGRLAGYKNRKPSKNDWTNLVCLPNPSLAKFDPTPFLQAAKAPSSPRGGGVFQGGDSASEKEFGHALNRLRWFQEMGKDVQRETEKIRVKLMRQAEDRGKHNPADYARRTIEAVLSALSFNEGGFKQP